MPGPWDTISRSEEETRRMGRALGRLLQPGHLVLLEGPLGAGKTVFVQGVAEGMGLEERVTSPTFTLVHHYGYEGGPGGADGSALVHADLYRLEDPAEVDELGLDDAAAEAPVVVEWWSRAPDGFPPGRLELEIEVDAAPGKEAVRRLRARATDPGHQRLLDAWRQALERDSGEDSSS